MQMKYLLLALLGAIVLQGCKNPEAQIQSHLASAQDNAGYVRLVNLSGDSLAMLLDNQRVGSQTAPGTASAFFRKRAKALPLKIENAAAGSSDFEVNVLAKRVISAYLVKQGGKLQVIQIEGDIRTPSGSGVFVRFVNVSDEEISFKVLEPSGHSESDIKVPSKSGSETETFAVGNLKIQALSSGKVAAEESGELESAKITTVIAYKQNNKLKLQFVQFNPAPALSRTGESGA